MTETANVPCKGRITGRTNLVCKQRNNAAKEKRIGAMLAHVQVTCTLLG